MPGNARSDIKLGFYIGVGLLLLGFALMLVQLFLRKAAR
jgi:hypothetical protein